MCGFDSNAALILCPESDSSTGCVMGVGGEGRGLEDMAGGFRNKRTSCLQLGFPGKMVVKNPPANAEDAGDMGSIPGSGRSPGGGNGNPLQYSCLDNPMDRGAWRATVQEVMT